MTKRSDELCLTLTLAQALGEDPEAITATNPRWLQLMREGVLVRLHIGRWRARTSLRWRDLGVVPGQGEEERVLDEILDLGHKFLLPRNDVRALDSADSSARKWLERNAFRTYWGFFVPVTAYAEWKAGNEEFWQQYLAIRDRLATDYDQTIARVLAKYHVAARAAYRRLRALHPEAMQGASETDFATRFVDEVSRHIPTQEAFYDSFYFDVELEYVPLPSLLAEEQAEAARIQAEVRAEQEQRELALRLARERAWAEEEKIRADVTAARSAAAWKEQLMREMHREVVEQARQRKEQVIDSFLRDVVAQLRTLAYEVATDVLASLQKNDRLHPRSVVQLRNLVEQVERLNFAGDADLDSMLTGVRVQLDLAAEDRSAREVERVLRDVAVVTRSTLIGLGEQPRSARSLGVPDELAPALVRTARGRLGLDGHDARLQALPLPGILTPIRRRVRVAPQPVALPM
jgi:hypothetical protein